MTVFATFDLRVSKREQCAPMTATLTISRCFIEDR